MPALNVEWFDSLPSTNGHLREMLRADPHLRSGIVIAARAQTEGRGRRGRSWFMGANQDLAFSILLRTDASPEWLPSLPIAAALSVREGLARFGLACKLKWPNDVLAGGRKIAGILTERVGEDESERHIMILGIGVNVNMTESEAAVIDRPATSVYMETGAEASVEDVLAAVLKAFELRLADWEANGFAGLAHRVVRHSAELGKAVKVGEEGRCVSGTVVGYGNMGQLLLRDAEGKVRVITLGEIL